MPCPMQAVHLTDSSVLVHAAHPVGQDFDLLESSEEARGKRKFRQRRERKKRIDLMYVERRYDFFFYF